MTYYRPFVVFPRFSGTFLLVVPAHPPAPELALQHVHRGTTIAVFAASAEAVTPQDLIAVYNDGALVEAGTGADLMNSGGRYAALRTAWTRGGRS